MKSDLAEKDVVIYAGQKTKNRMDQLYENSNAFSFCIWHMIVSHIVLIEVNTASLWAKHNIAKGCLKLLGKNQHPSMKLLSFYKPVQGFGWSRPEALEYWYLNHSENRLVAQHHMNVIILFISRG